MNASALSQQQLLECLEYGTAWHSMCAKQGYSVSNHSAHSPAVVSCVGAAADPETGQALFAGPRVRMGLHWASEGTVAMRVHNLTRHKVFAGPSVQTVMDVSEAANGGQILLTEVRYWWHTPVHFDAQARGGAWVLVSCRHSHSSS